MKKELWLVIGVVAIVLAVVVNTGDIGLGPRGGPVYGITDLDTPRSCNVDGSATQPGVSNACIGAGEASQPGGSISNTIDDCEDVLGVMGTVNDITLTKIGNDQLQVTCEIEGSNFMDIISIFAELYYKSPGNDWESVESIYAENPGYGGTLPIFPGELYSLEFAPFGVAGISGVHHVRCVHALHVGGPTFPGSDACSVDGIDKDDMKFSVFKTYR